MSLPDEKVDAKIPCIASGQVKSARESRALAGPRSATLRMHG
jgi:hypothetical protein